jgi:hypothetical protein
VTPSGHAPACGRPAPPAKDDSDGKVARPFIRSLSLGNHSCLSRVCRQARQGKGDAKKAGEIAIKALEQQIHEQKEQEKAALRNLDERYEHIIKSMDPKEIHGQLEEILVLLRQVQVDLGRADNLN